MNGKERLLTAMRRGVPDRVPVAPELFAMVPLRMSGKPFWDSLLYRRPALGRLYIDAARHFGIDAWYLHDDLCFGNARFFEPGSAMISLFVGGPMVPVGMTRVETLSRSEETITVRTAIDTPMGPLEKVDVYPVDDFLWPQQKWIKDIGRDWPRLAFLMGDDWRWTRDKPFYNALGDLGTYSLPVLLPLDWWFHIRDGASEQAALDLLDHPSEMEEIFATYARCVRALVHAYLDVRPDDVHLQGSCSSLSLTSPTLHERFNMPFIKEISHLCRANGMPTHLHICGRSALLVQWAHESTEVDVMEPLEGPPGGDVDLGEAKRRYGDRLCLKGNLNTYQLMLRGTRVDVERAAKAAIDAAAEGGGFILSTGDQCGRDTPHENIFVMVEVAKSYGRYT